MKTEKKVTNRIRRKLKESEGEQKTGEEEMKEGDEKGKMVTNRIRIKLKESEGEQKDR